MRLEEVIGTLQAMPLKKRVAVIEEAYEQTKHLPWVSNPGPQYEAARLSQADELFYGGQAGGGKSDLLIGLATTDHKKSLLVRRTNRESLGLVERMAEILCTRDGWSSKDGMWRYGSRLIDIGGCEHENDKQKYKGKPHDFYGFDEIPDFTETQYTFIIGWNRSTDPDQRCRVVVCGNPPTHPEGLWVIRRWAAWLDPNHPKPAKPGELRYYTTGEDGTEIEVDGPGPHRIGGQDVIARSRTFIPAELQDNPDLAKTNYAAVLSALPIELRRAYRDGDFTAGLQDAQFQLIPSDWVRDAQARWTPRGFEGLLMSAIALDPAGGGKDPAALAARYGGWYGPLETCQGAVTADGSAMCALIVKHRRNQCAIVIDAGGGYGGATMLRMRDNNIEFLAYNAASHSTARTKDGKLTFVDKRAEVMWKFREELDPEQEGGSVIALPPDPELVADLTAPTFTVKRGGIRVESKEELRERLGRSTNKGDAVVMCLSEGDKQAARAQRRNRRQHSGPPKVITRASQRARR